LALLVTLMGCGGLTRRHVAPAAPAHTEQGRALSPGTATAIDAARLRRLFEERTAPTAEHDYPIGAGDLIEISVPAMPELQHEQVRVSGSGEISLPLLGTLQAAGRTEAQLRDDLEQRLRAFMHQPEMALLVKEYRSRQVGVLGSVKNPGLHTLSYRNATILDTISEAGGLTEDATQRLLFMPVEIVQNDEAQRLAMVGGIAAYESSAQTVAAAHDGQVIKATDPIVIDLENMNERWQHFALAVPVRPGDTIIALGGGQIFVQGWVKEPGAYPMTRGLTLLGAIAGAGGGAFPAKRNTVRILRDDGGKERTLIVANLDEIERGHAIDPPLREGDLVQVDATGTKLAAYGVYSFFTNVIRVGLSMATPF
jgi:polysaccharide export outer membrane protein